MRPDRGVAAAVLTGLLLTAGPAAPAARPSGAASGPPAVAGAAATHLLLAAPAAPDEVRRATDEVLSRRAYAVEERSWWQQRLDDVRRWVAGRLLAILQATSRSAVAWTVLSVAVLAAGIVAWRLVRGTQRDPSRPVPAVDRERRSAAGWDALSREAERHGDLREAVRTAYRAVLAGYAEAGLVAEVSGRTVGEYRRDVATADPRRREAFSRASDVVEAVLYADRPARPGDLAAVRRAGRTRLGAGA